MEVVLVQVLGVDAVAGVIEGVSKVVVLKGVLVANLDFYKPTILKVHPPICGRTAHATTPC
jgi:hypothetical protein